jgi:hypothetical protein
MNEGLQVSPEVESTVEAPSDYSCHRPFGFVDVGRRSNSQKVAKVRQILIAARQELRRNQMAYRSHWHYDPRQDFDAIRGESADKRPADPYRIQIRSGLDENCLNRVHDDLLTGPQPETVSQLTARPTKPRLHLSLDLLV